jgi:hypothetical protein
VSLELRVRRFGAALAALYDELDWERLGRTYCEGDGSKFLDERLRAEVLDVGLQFADDVARALAPGCAQCSLYLGAAVAELAPMLAESIVLEREVRWLNLDGEESRELARAADAVSERLGVGLPRPNATALASIAPASCGHLWMVSVLTDPDQFPALHDDLYRRSHGSLATGRGDLEDDRRRARELGEALLARAAPPCVLTTTDEELVVLRPLAPAAGFALRVPAARRISAIVGDGVRSCRLEALPC